jgi:antitoxin MazE
MQTTIVKWGNSQGIRIPKAFLQSIQLVENDPVDVLLENGKIIISRKNIKGHKTIKERLLEFYGDKIDQNPPLHNEIDWGKPVGKEIW